METIYRAELVLLALPEHAAGAYVGGCLTIATPLSKHWHRLRAADSPTIDALLLDALDDAQHAGIDHLRVLACTLVDAYLVTDQDDEVLEGDIDLESPCER
jgi:hypothetical protein